jgi:hypothetical protein
MKKVILAVASALAGAVLATTLPAGAHHTTSTIRLSNRIAALEDMVYNCMYVQGMSSYGDPDFGFGFLYAEGLDEFLTTALDYDDSGEPQMWALGADESCIDLSRRESAGFNRLSRPASNRRSVRNR